MYDCGGVRGGIAGAAWYSSTTLDTLLCVRRVAIYCRISDDREGAGLGVARQELDCRQGDLDLALFALGHLANPKLQIAVCHDQSPLFLSLIHI